MTGAWTWVLTDQKYYLIRCGTQEKHAIELM